jgi:pimeloyl-ACP methyl ester carboxylesterase
VDARAVRCPVLCVAGGRDQLLAPSVARNLARRYGGDLIVIPGGGHWLLAGSLLEVVAKPVLAWINRLGEPAPVAPNRSSASFRQGADL